MVSLRQHDKVARTTSRSYFPSKNLSYEDKYTRYLTGSHDFMSQDFLPSRPQETYSRARVATHRNRQVRASSLSHIDNTRKEFEYSPNEKTAQQAHEDPQKYTQPAAPVNEGAWEVGSFVSNGTHPVNCAQMENCNRWGSSYQACEEENSCKVLGKPV